MAGRERLLDPTGDSDRTADTTLSPRLRSVRGLTVGLLENAKPNAAVLLSNVARELQRGHGLRAAVIYTKSYFGTPTPSSVPTTTWASTQTIPATARPTRGPRSRAWPPRPSGSPSAR